MGDQSGRYYCPACKEARLEDGACPRCGTMVVDDAPPKLFERPLDYVVVGVVALVFVVYTLLTSGVPQNDGQQAYLIGRLLGSATLGLLIGIGIRIVMKQVMR